MKNNDFSLDLSFYQAGTFEQTASGETYLKLTENEGYKLIAVKPDVKRIYIEVTTKCNFNCITCMRHTWDESLSNMSWETFETVLSQLRSLPDLKSVHFGGFGEPMMHPRIFDMIKAVKSLGLEVEMISNGSFLTDDHIERLIDLALDQLYTSVDSPDEVQYNHIRVGADYSSVTDNIRRLQQRKNELGTVFPKLGIEFVAMKENFNQLPGLIKLARELKASKIIVSNLMPYHESMKDAHVYDLDDSGVLFGKESLKTTIFAEISNMMLRTERTCKFIDDHTLSINYLGKISPCYAMMHSHTCFVYGRMKKMSACYAGDVNENMLSDIWMSKAYINFRRHVKENKFPSCTDCKYQEGCTYTEDNQMDCWGNSPSCGDCLWARGIIACP